MSISSLSKYVTAMQYQPVPDIFEGLPTAAAAVAAGSLSFQDAAVTVLASLNFPGTSMMYDMTLSISEIELRTRFVQNQRTLRGAQGLSQEALADIAGVHRTFVSQVERGLKSLSLDSIRKLANALSVDLLELFRHRDN
jgi:DNA-binding XRE family transcriptional regulator